MLAAKIQKKSDEPKDSSDFLYYQTPLLRKLISLDLFKEVGWDVGGGEA